MAKQKVQPYICRECSAEYSKWLGKCEACESWNTIEERAVNTRSGASTSIPQRFLDVEITSDQAVQNLEIEFLNRVVGGGLPRDAVVLLAGEPGIGKSTLLLQLFAQSSESCLYVTAEESVEQIASRFQKHKAKSEELYILSESRLSAIVAQMNELKPKRLAIDSIQMISVDSGLEKARGFSSSIREATEVLIHEAKRLGVQLWIVGHITKDGEIAGPKTLEHLVDTVLTFSSSDEPGLRLLQAQKNRFGPSGEIVLLEMNESGLRERPDAQGFWMSQNAGEVVGCAHVPVVLGSRVYCVEVQALCTPTYYPSPRRSTSGFDLNRLHLLCAVLERHLQVPLSKVDVYLNVVGGIRLQDPAVDLAVAMAILSSHDERAIPVDWAFCGELGLTGEVRKLPQLAERARVLSRVGKRVLCCASAESLDKKEKIAVEVQNLRHLKEAYKCLLGASQREMRKSPRSSAEICP